METKHTKGEWIYDKTSYRITTDGKEIEQTFTISTDKTYTRKSIARLVVKSEVNEFGYSLEETESNAKLIASAPDLLKALKELNDEVIKMCSIGSDPLLMDMLIKSQNAWSAIHKATK